MKGRLIYLMDLRVRARTACCKPQAPCHKLARHWLGERRQDSWICPAALILSLVGMAIATGRVWPSEKSGLQDNVRARLTPCGRKPMAV